MSTRLQLLAAIAGSTGALAVAAPAAHALTVSVGDATLIGKVALSVPVVVSCDPLDPTVTLNSTGVSVTAQQASGRDIAVATGSLFSSPFPGMGVPGPLF